MVILVLNCGSSSIKYQVIDMEAQSSKLLAKGLVERIGLPEGDLTHKPVGKEKFELHQPIPDHTTGISLVLQALTDPVHGVIRSLDEVKAVGHRVAHGGEFFPESCLVTEQVQEKIRSLFQIAPLHNPANLVGIEVARELFAGVPEARSRGYTPGRFSFNVRGGRCEACQGDGVIKVEMHFLPDIYVPCDQCKGKRYNRETLEIKYKGKTIHEVLDMTIEEAREFFDAVPALARKLQTLMDVGLTYIRLGQSATTLSGGEAQRVKLARELSKRGTGQTLYILDEPTTGLHFADIQQLLEVLHQLRDQGNTIVVIEHNLDVIKTADWIVDLGPEGGSGGGEILVSGTPETVAECEASHTARFLKPLL